MRMLNKSAIRKYVKNNGLRISATQLDLTSNILGQIVEKEVDKIVRRAAISGRKNIRKEDILGVGL